MTHGDIEFLNNISVARHQWKEIMGFNREYLFKKRGPCNI